MFYMHCCACVRYDKHADWQSRYNCSSVLSCMKLCAVDEETRVETRVSCIPSPTVMDVISFEP